MWPPNATKLVKRKQLESDTQSCDTEVTQQYVLLVKVTNIYTVF